MDRILTSRKTISLRTWRRPSAAATTTATEGSASTNPPRPKTSRHRSDGGVPLNPLLIDTQALEIDHDSDAEERLPPIPTDSCLVLKYLVDFLLKSKLHKNDLFLVDAKQSEKSKLLQCILAGELPERLSQYSSRSVSFAVLNSITHTFAPIFPRECCSELLRRVQEDGPREAQIAYVARVLQWNMSAERRALFESLVLLLHRLSLKATMSMNADALGSLVAVKLVGNRSDPGNAGSACLPPRVGKLLVECAPEILSERQALARSNADERASYDFYGSPYQRARSSNAAALSSASKIISRSIETRQGIHEDSDTHDRAIEKSPLDEELAQRVSVVLTVILDSPETKFGLFTKVSESREIPVATFLRGEADAAVLSSCDTIGLGSQLVEFLVSEVAPLFHSFQCPHSENLDLDFSHDNRFLDQLQRFILDQLAPFAQDVLVLLVAAVRLSIDAGTDLEHLVLTFAPWMFVSHSDCEEASRRCESCCHVLFMHMHAVLQPLMTRRGREASARRISVMFHAVVWVTRCRMRVVRSRQRRQQALLPWSESMASCLSEIVEMLLEQTRAYPSQLRRLYLDSGDEMEISILVEKLCIDGASISAEIFSPHSAALAMRRILTTMVQPLGSETAKSRTHLKRLLLTHLDILLRHENSNRVRCDLEETFDQMLYHDTGGHMSDQHGEYASDKEPQAGYEDDANPECYDEQSTFKTGCDESTTRVADTLSEWLAMTADSATKKSPSQLHPPMGFTLDALRMLQNRLCDIRFVMGHCCAVMQSSATNQGLSIEILDERRRLLAILEVLKIPSVLVPRARAMSTLHRLQAANRENKVSVLSARKTAQLTDLEIIETLVLETHSTLRHPCLSPLYPNHGDHLGVLLDVWGLGDRSVVFSRTDDQLESL